MAKAFLFLLLVSPYLTLLYKSVAIWIRLLFTTLFLLCIVVAFAMLAGFTKNVIFISLGYEIYAGWLIVFNIALMIIIEIARLLIGAIKRTLRNKTP